MNVTNPIDPLPDERGDCPDTPVPLRGHPLLQLQGEEFRLNQTLRAAAKLRDPYEILARAAEVFYLENTSDPVVRQGPSGLGHPLVDLALTGRVSYAKFRDTTLDEASLREKTRARLAQVVDAIPAELADAVSTVLDRAYAVAWALRGPVGQRDAARAALVPNWIAVSGEDDKPHRPVNVPPPMFIRADTGAVVDLEQFEIPVPTPDSVLPAFQPFIQTRFFIASAVEDPAPTAIPQSTRALPPAPPPKIPDGHNVILFLHGHSSGAEEALAIIPHILAAGLERGTKYSVVSIDLPNNGYSESFDHTKVALPDATTYPAGIFDHGTPIQTPILDFIENFIVAFVDALDLKSPFKNRFAGVIGGSLGGNLGLRLGRRGQLRITQGGTDDSPWLKSGIVSWSAASVGVPMVQNEAFRHGPDDSMAKAKEDETHDSRRRYFSQVYDESVAAGTPAEIVEPHAQPYFWYRDDWEPCKTNHIAASRIARQEIYNRDFRQWHWRVAAEQVIYSHIDRLDHHHENNPQNTNPKRYELNTVRQLLVAGEKDDDKGLGIYPNTRNLAAKMVHTPGQSLFLNDTGHSIHFERPKFLAGNIVDFLPGPKRTDISFLTPLLLSDSSTDISFLTPLLLSQP